MIRHVDLMPRRVGTATTRRRYADPEASAARRAGVSEVHHHADSAKAAESIAEFLKEGDLIVVKGSRGMRMERVVQALVAQCGEA